MSTSALLLFFLSFLNSASGWDFPDYNQHLSIEKKDKKYEELIKAQQQAEQYRVQHNKDKKLTAFYSSLFLLVVNTLSLLFTRKRFFKIIAILALFWTLKAGTTVFLPNILSSNPIFTFSLVLLVAFLSFGLEKLFQKNRS